MGFPIMNQKKKQKTQGKKTFIKNAVQVSCKIIGEIQVKSPT